MLQRSSMKNQIELDNSVSARFLKEGKFIHPLKGITFYIKSIETDGTLIDIFFMIKEIKMRLCRIPPSKPF